MPQDKKQKTSKNEAPNLGSIPKDINKYITSFLDVGSMAKLASTSKSYNKLLKEHIESVKDLYIRLLKSGIAENISSAEKQIEESLKSATKLKLFQQQNGGFDGLSPAQINAAYKKYELISKVVDETEEIVNLFVIELKVLSKSGGDTGPLQKKISEITSSCKSTRLQMKSYRKIYEDLGI